MKLKRDVCKDANSKIVYTSPTTGKKLLHGVKPDQSNVWCCEGCQWAFHLPEPLKHPERSLEPIQDGMQEEFDKHQCADYLL